MLASGANFFARSIELVIQTNLRGVDAVEAVVEDKRPARHDIPGTGSCKAASLEIMIVKADEHVFALHAPVWGKRPFDSSADCPRGGGFAARGRNEPIAASSGGGSALIEDRSLGPNESGAALDVEQNAVKGVSQPAGNHAGPTADLRAPQHIKSCLCTYTGIRIKGLAIKPEVAEFALKSEHKG